MKKINKKSEEMLLEAFKILNNIEVKGKNVFRLGNVMTLLQEISKQINTPPEEENKEKEE